MRVALSYDLGDWPVTAEVRAATEQAGRTLDQLGAVVEEVDVTVERALVRQASNAHNGVLFAASPAGDVKGREDRVSPYVLAWLDEVPGEVTPTSTSSSAR